MTSTQKLISVHSFSVCKKMTDHFIVAQEKYENGNAKPHIETQLNIHINPLFEQNLKFKLVQWRYFKEGSEDIEDLRNRNQYNQMYLTVIESHISKLISDARIKLTEESKKIEQCFERKQDSIASADARDKRDSNKELSVLSRLNKMPEDIVYAVGQFLFTKRMRLVLIRDRFAPFNEILRKVKLPKLKLISRCVAHHLQAIARKITNNKSIMASFPANSEISDCYDNASQSMKKLRETLNKAEKIKEIVNITDKASFLVRSVDKLGYPVNTGHIQTILLRIYHIIIYASKPEFNKRTRTV
jgi:flagellar biosynthesis regulator FlaF